MVDAIFEANMENTLCIVYCVVDGSFTKGGSVVDATFEADMENTTASITRVKKTSSIVTMIASRLGQQLDRAVQEIVVIERPKHNETILHIVLVSYINTKCCNTRSYINMCALPIA